MKRVYFLLLLLWLIPVVIAQLLIGFVSASPALVNAQPRLRVLLQANDTSCTVEVAADGTVSGLLTLGEDHWTK